ncbi:TatD family hydrolase [Metallosphaera tengchongensis]|uniref:TatD family hydrolase n=1 Tax=Metallosphaera tengchongensis TaxID=1532350 RepID=A0A6N0NWB5_9CREN|nr:TatD family hydrolase [Metallosphaera tengchongensis]QKQ99647.1 TatD family hydrolase [Metallosphaera tengchongensis]
MLIDSHAHVDVKDFDPDRDLVLSKCQITVVNAGVDLKSNLLSIEMSKVYRNVIPAVGLHPEYVERADQELEETLRLIDLVPLISEVGLDFFWIKEEPLRAKQIQVLNRFMEVGEKQGKALIIHSRGGLKKIMEMVSSYKVRFAIHAFEGSVKDAKRIEEMGGFISVPPILVRDKGRMEVVRNVSEDSLLTETDSPFMGPDRTRNEPCNVKITLQRISEIKGINLIELEEKIENNFRRLLGPYSFSGANLTNR